MVRSEDSTDFFPYMFLSDGIDSAIASFIDLPAPMAVDAMKRKSLNSAIYLLRLSLIILCFTISFIFPMNGMMITAKSRFLYSRYEITSPAAAVVR